MKKKFYLMSVAFQGLLAMAILSLFFAKFTVVDSITRTSQTDRQVAESQPRVVYSNRQDQVQPMLTSSVNQEKSDLPVKQEEAKAEVVEEQFAEEAVSEVSEPEEVVVEPEVVAEAVQVEAESEVEAVVEVAAEQVAEQPQVQAQSDAVAGVSDEAAAKEEIARRESGGSYTAQNGRFYGRYQLDLAYLNGDLSPENQERVADAYVAGRYGSWVAALEHSNSHGWY